MRAVRSARNDQSPVTARFGHFDPLLAIVSVLDAARVSEQCRHNNRPGALCMLTYYSDDHHLHHGKCELIDGQLMPCFEKPQRADHGR